MTLVQILRYEELGVTWESETFVFTTRRIIVITICLLLHIVLCIVCCIMLYHVVCVRGKHQHKVYCIWSVPGLE